MMIYYKIKEEEENKETLVKHAMVGISEGSKTSYAVSCANYFL
jgi:hypothetical protein